MDKLTALKTLIENSTILNDEVKQELLNKLGTMSQQDVESLGRLLAKEMEMNVDENEEFRKIIIEAANGAAQND